MFKRLIQLAIVALIANAGYRIGNEYLTFIKFRDDVRDAATFKATTDEDLTAQIMELAGEYELPIEPEALSIRRVSQRVSVDGSYVKPIEVVPTYFYPWHFSWSIQATVSIIVQPYQRMPPKKK